MPGDSRAGGPWLSSRSAYGGRTNRSAHGGEVRRGVRFGRYDGMDHSGRGRRTSYISTSAERSRQGFQFPHPSTLPGHPHRAGGAGVDYFTVHAGVLLRVSRPSRTVPPDPRHRPVLRPHHQRHRGRAYRLVRHGHALLRHAQGASGAPGPGRREAGAWRRRRRSSGRGVGRSTCGGEGGQPSPEGHGPLIAEAASVTLISYAMPITLSAGTRKWGA